MLPLYDRRLSSSKVLFKVVCPRWYDTENTRALRDNSKGFKTMTLVILVIFSLKGQSSILNDIWNLFEKGISGPFIVILNHLNQWNKCCVYPPLWLCVGPIQRFCRLFDTEDETQRATWMIRVCCHSGELNSLFMEMFTESIYLKQVCPINPPQTQT